ncbi:MAG: YebC/PmpR family DNA-binding transcriptional regulator [Sphingomicrobium sp.]
MAGHSKYKNIMYRKGAQDKKRSAMFSKLSREITVAAKMGLPDPDANARLRAAIIAARAQSMPKDNIQRSIDKASGSDAENYEEVRYEGFGPGGVALIVEALTDNRNRTAADVRFAFSKFGGSLGTPGSVAWMFERKGVITIPVEAVDEDTITMTAAEGGAEDVRQDGDTWVVTSEPHDFPALRTALEAAEIPIDNAGLSLLPKTQVEVDADQARTLLRMVDLLEESDDVQDVYFNFDIPDAVLADA